VFGVNADPFEAHCWVQAGSVVLNDTLGRVSSFTPIMSV
jgi:Transglutaminase-like superfamily